MLLKKKFYKILKTNPLRLIMINNVKFYIAIATHNSAHTKFNLSDQMFYF